MKILKGQALYYNNEDGKRIYETHPNKKDINTMYNLIEHYCKKNKIPLSYDDAAEWFIDALTKYLDDSEDKQNNKEFNYKDFANWIKETKFDYCFETANVNNDRIVIWKKGTGDLIHIRKDHPPKSWKELKQTIIKLDKDKYFEI
jgi:hypothetical protein